MTPPLWAIETAADLLGTVRQAPAFPRDWKATIQLYFSIAVQEIDGLTVSRILERLKKLGIRGDDFERQPDRRLHGALFFRGPAALIFLETRSSPAERRFTLAHEFAHYLREYWRPKRLAVAKLGPKIGEVFDARREATPEERLQAVLRSTVWQRRLHLFDRDRRGGFASDEIRRAEEEADVLACELLAPHNSFENEIIHSNRHAMISRLLDEFGLPPGIAENYASRLIPAPPTSRWGELGRS